jgi:uncharacterized protein DUF2513
MKRDMDLIRQILLELEAAENLHGVVDIQAPGYSPDQVTYHVKLLAEAGLIEARNRSHLRGIVWQPSSLTWRGHEFLDATRNASVWQKLKAELKDRGVTLPFELVQQLALKIAASMAGL